MAITSALAAAAERHLAQNIYGGKSNNVAASPKIMAAVKAEIIYSMAKSMPAQLAGAKIGQLIGESVMKEKNE
jgi:hypothetical protein